MAKNESTAVWNPANAKITKQLSTSFRMKQDQDYHMQVLSPIFEDPNAGSGDRTMAAPMVARMLDLTDGREFDIILASIPQKRLEEGYPDGSFVGKCFKIVQHAVRGNKRYRDYDIDEIDASDSPHYRSPADVIKSSGNYGPRKEKKAKKG